MSRPSLALPGALRPLQFASTPFDLLTRLCTAARIICEFSLTPGGRCGFFPGLKRLVRAASRVVFAVCFEGRPREVPLSGPPKLTEFCKLLASAIKSGAESRRIKCLPKPALFLRVVPAAESSVSQGPPLSRTSESPKLDDPPTRIDAHAERPAGSNPRVRASPTSRSNLFCASGVSNASSFSATATRAKPLANCVPETTPAAPKYPSSSVIRRTHCGLKCDSSIANTSARLRL